MQSSWSNICRFALAAQTPILPEIKKHISFPQCSYKRAHVFAFRSQKLPNVQYFEKRGVQVRDIHFKLKDSPPGNRVEEWCCLPYSINASLNSKYNFPLSETSKTFEFHHTIYIQVATIERVIVSTFFFLPWYFCPECPLCAGCCVAVPSLTYSFHSSPSASPLVHIQLAREQRGRGEGRNTKRPRGAQGTNALIPGARWALDCFHTDKQVNLRAPPCPQP